MGLAVMPRRRDARLAKAPMCFDCPLRRICLEVCSYVEFRLPSLEAGRVDHEDLERLYHGRIMVHALLDNVAALTARQQQVVQLYYRENLQQKEIAEKLSITQQAVGDALLRAKHAVGKKLKRYYSFL
jgi:RNA polymerase sigma factor (sigma-70 family)